MKIRILILIFLSLTISPPVIGESKESVDRLIGQLLLPYFPGEEANEEMAEWLADFQPAGVLLYNWSNGLGSPEQVTALTTGLQQIAREKGLPPLFIAVDQEGGRVTRLRDGFLAFPSNANEAADSAEAVRDRAQSIAVELRSVGVNFNFAPVVDVNSNSENPVLGDRSYGVDPALVARLGGAATEGFRRGKVISCLKHFPGHGNVTVDSHVALPLVERSRQELNGVELFPFREILNHSPAIMSAHIRMPALDPEACATLSRKILTDLLQDELGYRGLICSDSLVMDGLLEDCGDLGEAAVRAIEAGCDLLVVGGRALLEDCNEDHLLGLKQIQAALSEAVVSGRISKPRLRRSVDKILAVKQQYELHADDHAIPCRAAL